MCLGYYAEGCPSVSLWQVPLSPRILSHLLPGDPDPGWGNVNHLAQ